MEKRRKDITAVILAGGKSTRFGGDKAFAKIDKVPMVEHVIRTLQSVFTNILVVTNSPGKYTGYPEISVTTDIIKNAGPLGGIHAAMNGCKTPSIFVFSCDIPFADKNLIAGQLDFFRNHQNADALIPRTGERIEPLHAIYRCGLAGSLANFLDKAEDCSIRAFLQGKTVVYFDLPLGPREIKAFSNINKPSDIPGQPGE
jgi:molybdopterin-guanine dinucleotide biosynthesis protein A